MYMCVEEQMYLWIRGEDAECVIDLILCDTTTNVKEVSWLAFVKLYDIHSGHSKPCTVN